MRRHRHNVVPFRQPRPARRSASWGEAARSIWPALLAIPLAVVSAFVFLDGPPTSQAMEAGDTSASPPWSQADAVLPHRTGWRTGPMPEEAVFEPLDASETRAGNSPGTGTIVRKQFAPCSGPIRTNCVVDGDTIWLDGAKIRIADIDTPEVSRPGCAAEARMGQRATRRLTQLLNGGAFAVLPNPDGRDEDRYGRKLRILSRGGQSIGATLVSEGLAEQWGGPRIAWC